MGGFGSEAALGKAGITSVEETPAVTTIRAEIAVKNDKEAIPVDGFIRDSVFTVLGKDGVPEITIDDAVLEKGEKKFTQHNNDVERFF